MYPTDIVSCGGRIFFSGAPNDRIGGELYEVVSTSPGFRLVCDIAPRLYQSGGPQHLTCVRGRLVFAANDGTTGRELWSLDPTTSKCTLLKDFRAGPVWSHPRRFFVGAGGRLLLVCDDDKIGSEPWTSDGTRVGTVPLGDLLPGTVTFSSNPRNITSALGLAFFRVSTRLWRTDGTETGTFALPRFGINNDFRTGLEIGDQFLFSGDNLLYATDGSDAEPRLLKTFAGTAQLQEFVDFRGRLLFFESNSVSSGVWISDGSRAGTIQLVSGLSDEEIRIVRAGRFAYLHLVKGCCIELWRTDGTPSGTIKLLGPFQDLPLKKPDNYVVLGDRVLFTAWESSSGRELWVSDGSVVGTKLLRDVRPGPLSSDARPIVSFSDRVWISYDNKLATQETWVSDGTVAGTSKVFDNPANASWSRATVVDGGYYFQSDLGNSTIDVGFSDGTLAGTRHLGLLHAVPEDVDSWIPIGGREILIHSRISGGGLWQSDGTVAGTRRLLNYSIALQSHGPARMMRGQLIFAGTDLCNDEELWMVGGIGSATSVGEGSAATGPLPELLGTPARFGSRVSLSLRNGVPNTSGVLFLGAPRYSPYLLGPSVAIRVELRLPTMVIGTRTNSSGTWRVSLPVPPNPALLGAEVMAQAGLGPTMNPPVNMDFSGGLLIVLGT